MIFSKQQMGKADNSKYRILVIEDDQFIRELYLELLIDAGYKVEYATNGEEGYKKLQSGGFDLVVMDIIMPKMDAVQVLSKLKKNPPKKKNKKIIFMTNLGQENIIKNGNAYGVSGYFIKSDLDPDQFLKKIANSLN